MIASEDVRRVTFERAMRGYRCEDVDDYLKQVADSMDALSAENEDLQKKLVVLAQRIDQYRAEEDTLRTTMINAQRLGENVIREAKQKAAEIIRAANIKSEDREQHARDEVELAHQELITLKKEADSFKKTLMGMYREHIEVLSKIPEYHGEVPAPQEDDETVVYQQPATTEPAEQPPVYQEPAYQEPAAEVYEEPAPATEPEEDQPDAFDQDTYQATGYEDTEFYQPEEKPVQEGKVDTVEFAFAPKPEEADYPAQPEPEADEELPDASALFAEPASAAGKKSASRGRSAAQKTSRKPRTQPKPQDDLPSGFDSFQGVDYND